MSTQSPTGNPGQPRIVVLIESYLPILGGAQNNVHELCKRLSALGCRCEVLTRRYTSRHSRLDAVDGVTIRRSGLFPIRPFAKLFWAVHVMGYLVRHRRRYDLVLSVPIFYWADLLPAYLNRLLSGKPFVVRTTMAGNFSDMLTWRIASLTDLAKKLLFPPFLWHRVLAKAAVLVAQSELLFERARAFKLPRVTLIPNGVDTERFSTTDQETKAELRRKFELPLDHTLVICTGRYVVEKNQIVLLQAINRLVRSDDSRPVFLLLLGIEEFNPALATEEQLREFVEVHNLDDQVLFLRDVEQVEEYLKASDIFVLPTKFDEGVSNSVLEAMSCGLPVVCSDLPQLKGMFPPGQGLFFEPDDVEKLFRHLRQLLVLPDQGSSQGLQLANHIRETQPIERTIDQYAALLGNAARQGFHRAQHPSHLE